MGWGTEAAKKVLNIAEKQQRAREWTVFAAKVKTEKSGELWDELVQQVKTDVDEFAEGSFIRSEVRIEHLSPNNLTIQRFLAPLQKLEFVFTPSKCVTVFWNGRQTEKYSFRVDDRGDLWFIDEVGEFISLEGISLRSCAPLVKFYCGVAT